MWTAAANVAGADYLQEGRLRPWYLVAAVLGGIAAALAIGSCLCGQSTAPEPPAIVLQEVDPAVAGAVQEAYEAVQRSPRSAAAWGRLGRVLLAHDFLSEANACLSQAERLDRREPRWPYYQGVALTLGNPDAAIPKLERAVELCGDTPDAPRLRLAEVLLGQGRSAEAGTQFHQLLRCDPGHPRAHLGLARLSYQHHDLSAALGHLRRCGDNPFTRQAAAALWAEVRQRMGEPKPLLPPLPSDAALAADPAWPDPFLEEVEQVKTGRQGGIARMESLLAQKRVPEAIRLLRQQLRDDPGSDWAWLWLGRLLIQQEQFVAAERALREAARQAPDGLETQFYLGVALYGQGKREEAARCFRRATELKPDYALAYYNLGHCLSEQGARTPALHAFRMAVRCKANFADAHINLGDLLLQSGEYGEALRHLRYATQLNPGDPRGKRLLHQVLGQLAGYSGP